MLATPLDLPWHSAFNQGPKASDCPSCKESRGIQGSRLWSKAFHHSRQPYFIFAEQSHPIPSGSSESKIWGIFSPETFPVLAPAAWWCMPDHLPQLFAFDSLRSFCHTQEFGSSFHIQNWHSPTLYSEIEPRLGIGIRKKKRSGPNRTCRRTENTEFKVAKLHASNADKHPSIHHVHKQHQKTKTLLSTSKRPHFFPKAPLSAVGLIQTLLLCPASAHGFRGLGDSNRSKGKRMVYLVWKSKY